MPKPDPARARRTATAAAVFDSQGRMLLHRRSDNNKWALPGGGIEVGETADQAIVREVKEETGYDVRVIRLIGIYSNPKDTTITYPEGDTVFYVSILFECTVIGGTPMLNEESTAIDWFSPTALPEPFHAGHIPRVRDAMARQQAAFYR
ncbi:MAG TPA: NUDIX domain-containing protein [Candidatus Methylacidiphilales bacterium]|nr:NUDIX domain-containing protein [Candidatus Methylacidiphilales bacterium]